MDPYGRYHPAVPGQPPRVSGHERVGNAQRTTVLDNLSRAVEEGYLDLDEYEVRMARVTQSKTVAALYGTVADLPPQFRWDPSRPTPTPGADPAVGATVASLILGLVSLPFSLCFGSGIVPGLLAVYLARKGIRDGETRSKAMAGLVLGIVGVAASIVVILIMLVSENTRTVS